jgi:hypothetical protein
MKWIGLAVLAYAVYTAVRVARNAAGFGADAKFSAGNVADLFVYYAAHPTDWPAI